MYATWDLSTAQIFHAYCHQLINSTNISSIVMSCRWAILYGVSGTHCDKLRCNTLWHAATHYNTLQHGRWDCHNEWVMPHNKWIITHIVCDMTHVFMWHDPFMCVTWLMYLCDMNHLRVWHDSCIYVTWPIYVCDMNHVIVWRDSFMCVLWIMYLCDMNHSCVWHDSCIYVTWLIHLCDMTHVFVWHNSFMCGLELTLTSDFFFWQLGICDSLCRRTASSNARWNCHM